MWPLPDLYVEMQHIEVLMMHWLHKAQIRTYSHLHCLLTPT